MTQRASAHGNDVFRVERRGFEHIPEPERNMTLRQVDHLWVGTSVNLFSFALGALAVAQGLGVGAALVACVIGNVVYLYQAVGSIITVRAGLPVTALARASFGMRGNWPNAFLSWLASVAFEVINTIFGTYALLMLFELLGWSHPGARGAVVAILLQLLMCGGIAVLGHATMIWMQRIFATLVSLALLTVIVFTVGRIDWTPQAVSSPSPLAPASLAAFFSAVGIIASNPLSFLSNGPDWVRYLPSRTTARAIVSHVFWSSYLPSVVLCMMGALCATIGDMSDPVAGLRPYVPSALLMLFVVSLVGGSLANNVPVYYSSGLALQAIGFTWHRNVATACDIVFSALIALYVVLVQDFSAAINSFIAILVVWVGPFGGVWICDGWLRRGQLDHYAIHQPATAGNAYWGWHGMNLTGCSAMLLGMLAAGLSMKSPVYEGPIARALGDSDLSWLIGFPVAALVYAGLVRLRRSVLRLAG